MLHCLPVPHVRGGIIRYWYAIGMLICWLAVFKFWPSSSALSHASPLCSQYLANRTECLEDQVTYAANANSSEEQALQCGSGEKLGLGLGTARHGQPKEELRQFHATHALNGHHSHRRLEDELAWFTGSTIISIFCVSPFLHSFFPKFDVIYVMTSLWQIIQKQPTHNYFWLTWLSQARDPCYRAWH